MEKFLNTAHKLIQEGRTILPKDKCYLVIRTVIFTEQSVYMERTKHSPNSSNCSLRSTMYAWFQPSYFLYAWESGNMKCTFFSKQNKFITKVTKEKNRKYK